jgi:hypothetical protein
VVQAIQKAMTEALARADVRARLENLDLHYEGLAGAGASKRLDGTFRSLRQGDPGDRDEGGMMARRPNVIFIVADDLGFATWAATAAALRSSAPCRRSSMRSPPRACASRRAMRIRPSARPRASR